MAEGWLRPDKTWMFDHWVDDSHTFLAHLGSGLLLLAPRFGGTDRGFVPGWGISDSKVGLAVYAGRCPVCLRWLKQYRAPRLAVDRLLGEEG